MLALLRVQNRAMDAPRGPGAAWPRIGAATSIALALALFLAVFAVRISDPDVGDNEGILFILPIGLLALRFGLRGGLAGALVGFALTGLWDRFRDHPPLTWLGLANRGIAFLSLGVLLGVFIDRRRTLEAQLRHSHAVSLDAQRKARRQLANSARSLEEKVAERTFELDDARAETLQLLAAAVEYRDDETSEHTERVGALAAEIASRLGLRSEQVKRLCEAASLHDVGKIAIPDRILLKRGNLTPEEHDAMEAHAALGARLLSRSSSPVLQMAAVIAATHHEWWNGTGYPSGLAGERIPIVGRIVAVADVFDALTHERPYKAAWPVSQAVARIKRGSGRQFDPRVVRAFLAIREDAVAVRPVAAQPPERRRASEQPHVVAR
ncbi:MAG: domain S-box protein [Solirubrobacterales bacterium]|nr:domain S-box protein [Solirubrobacterales bacterium]